MMQVYYHKRHTMKKIFLLLLIILLSTNIINSTKSAYFSISLNNKSDTLYEFDYDIYKYKTMDVYILHSNDLSKKEYITQYQISRFYIDNFNIFDISALYLRNKGQLSVSFDLTDSSIIISRNIDKYGAGKNDLFDDLSNYYITTCIKKQGDTVTIIHMDSKIDESYIEVILQFNK